MPQGPVVVAHTFDPTAWEGVAGGFEACLVFRVSASQPGLHSETPKQKNNRRNHLI